MANNEKWQSFKEELKAKNDIVSVVSKYVPLVQKGRSLWGRCPFHNEKTPSFTVNPSDQVYHCFGCGVGGDVIKFIQEIESVDFMGAINILAEMAHMEVPTTDGYQEDSKIKQMKEEKDRLLSLLKETAHHYVNNLKLPQAKPGLEYFEKRKISPELARRFGLGFAPNYNDTISYLTSKGYSLKEMEKAGVIKFRDERPYDAMGNRVVFPIMDISSNVVAFCGRSLETKPNFAKYLNTQDTMIFSKSKNLYAINLVKKAKMQGTKVDYLIVVEGQMDVVSLHKAGFVTAVASMGTALTQEQAKLIKRFVDKVYICYDGDTAGKKATLRGLDILKSNGLEVFVMSMPEGLDPDDVINRFGAEGYQKLLDRALPLIDFKLEFLKKLYDISTNDGKTKYINEALEILRTLSNVEQEVYIDKVSEISGIMKDFLKRQLESSKSVNLTENSKLSSNATKMVAVESENQNLKEKKAIDTNVVQAEKFVLSAFLHKKPFAFFKEDAEKYFTENRKQFYKKICELSKTEEEKNLPKKFYEAYCNAGLNETENEKLQEEASEIINYIMKNGDEENELAFYKDCIYLMFKNYAENKIEELNRQLENEIDREKRNQIFVQINELLGKIKTKKVEL